jgi:hypothetical protein
MQERSIKINNIIAITGEGEFEKKPRSLNDEMMMTALDLSKLRERDAYRANKENLLERLISHLEYLIKYTEEAHQACLMQQDHDELITRLVMNEFGLYTKDHPLTLDQYKKIITAIAGLTKDLAPNIHLVFATMPVLWPDGRIHNTGLYVQSPRQQGDKPLLHHFDKRTPAKNFDIQYLDENQQPYPLYRESYVENDYYGSDFSPDILLKDTAVQLNDINQYRGAINIETAEHRTFVVSLEICLENYRGLGRQDVKHLQEQLLADNKIPSERASQVVISNYIELTKENLFATVVQADPMHLPEHYNPSPKRRRNSLVFGNRLTLFTCQPVALEPIKQDCLHSSENAPYYVK